MFWQRLGRPFGSGFKVGCAFGWVPFRWPSKRGGVGRDLGWWWWIGSVLVGRRLTLEVRRRRLMLLMLIVQRG